MSKREFKTSNLNKVLYPKSGITKGEVIEYYLRVAPLMLPHVKDHPLVMQRYPEGIGGFMFFQKQIGDHFPDWFKRVTLTGSEGAKDYAVADSQESLAFLAQQAVLVMHTMTTTVKHPRIPDQIIWDLDPSGADDFENVRKYAFELRDVLLELGLGPFVKTTGSRGLHVVTPLRGAKDIDDARAFAHDVAVLLASRRPADLTTEVRKAKRKGRIFIDVARNGFGQTAAAPYTLRAIEKAPLAMPITWKELADKRLGPQTFNLGNIDKRLAKGDAWESMEKSAKPFAAAVRKLAAYGRGSERTPAKSAGVHRLRSLT